MFLGLGSEGKVGGVGQEGDMTPHTPSLPTSFVTSLVLVEQGVRGLDLELGEE